MHSANINPGSPGERSISMINDLDSITDKYLMDRVIYLEKNISNMQSFLAGAPEGNLVCRKVQNGGFRYYCNIRENQKYLPENEACFAKQLALKKL